MWLLLNFIAIIIGLLYLKLRQQYAYWALRGVPHEKPMYFLGNMHGLGRKYHWTDINARIYAKFATQARFVGFYTFISKAAFVMDLELIKNIMIKDFTSFADRGLFHNVRDDPLTGNLLFLDGEPWRLLRQKLSPVFTSGRMKYMFPTMVAVGERLVNACHRHIDVERGRGIEAKDLCALYTTDVIGTCAFGIECNSLENPQAEFRCMGRSIFEQPLHSTLIQAFMFTNPELARKLRLRNFRNEVSAFFMNAVRETVAFREREGIKRNDFMDILIELKQQQIEKVEIATDAVASYDLSQGLTLEQIAAQAMMFFLAGFDTSSTTMSFCLYELALNHEIQERLRTEIFEVLRRHNNQLTYECIKQMHYLDCVIAETLRKYPVLPHLVRRATADYVVPDSGGVIFERGLRIIIPVHAIHHDPSYYPHPEEFDPDRFAPDRIVTRPSFAYLPFGDGPRNCIGLRFGRMQAQIGIITLLRHFRFRRCARTQIPLRFSKKNFLIAAESGIYLALDRLDEKK